MIAIISTVSIVSGSLAVSSLLAVFSHFLVGSSQYYFSVGYRDKFSFMFLQVILKYAESNNTALSAGF